MEAISQIIEIKNNGKISTEYIENELTKLNICPLRWAIISVSDTIITVSVAKIQKQEG